MCAAVIAGTWAAHLYVWKKELTNMFLILSEENTNNKNYNKKQQEKNINKNFTGTKM